MLKRFKSFGWPAWLLLALAALALRRIEIVGDGGEYLLMTHAMLRHASVDIRLSDVADFLRLSAHDMHALGDPRGAFEALQQHMQASVPTPYAGFYPDDSGHFYAMHFWLYSLLALPYYAALNALGLPPLWAFGLLNVSFAALALRYIRRAMPTQAHMACALFLVAGTNFYLAWTGPEVMSASCALIACIALLRGELGLAMLVAAVGSVQNPPLALLMAAAVAFRAVLRFAPQLGWTGSAPAAVTRRDVAMGAAALLLAALPFAFFQLTFGMPSLIAHYATASHLITGNRLLSLFFDVNQGMLVGLPGLLAAFALALAMAAVARQGRWLLAALAALAAVVVMAIPALSAINWNSGCIVVMRYAYWLGMPLLAMLMLAMLRLAPRQARVLGWLALVLQLSLMTGYGVLGERSSSTRHTKLARWLLDHHPALYNPDAEILFERSIGTEGNMNRSTSYLYQHAGRPLKLLRHWTNLQDTAGLCPPGQVLESGDVRAIDSGWQYLHAPFNCRPAGQQEAITLWAIDAGNPASAAPLKQGWSALEGPGCWSVGARSTLTLAVPAGRAALRVRLVGHYYPDQSRSGVSVNGVELGRIDLNDGVIEVPAARRSAAQLEIVLRHPDASSPKSHHESPDDRDLGYYVQVIGLETQAR